jgi:hypothetical protein
LQLEEEVETLLKLYGSSSEKISPEEAVQGCLFDELEVNGELAFATIYDILGKNQEKWNDQEISETWINNSSSDSINPLKKPHTIKTG